MQVLVQQPGDPSNSVSELAPANAEMRWLVRRRVLPVPQLPKQTDKERTPRSKRFMADSIDHVSNARTRIGTIIADSIAEGKE